MSCPYSLNTCEEYADRVKWKEFTVDMILPVRGDVAYTQEQIEHGLEMCEHEAQSQACVNVRDAYLSLSKEDIFKLQRTSKTLTMACGNNDACVTTFDLETEENFRDWAQREIDPVASASEHAHRLPNQ